jgi:hypothetical protein
MLKYLVVINDKCHIQYPNYLKDLKVYYFMSKYLLEKQKFLDRIKENNNNNYMHKVIKKFFKRNNEKEKNLFVSKITHSDSDEDLKLNQKRGQGGLFSMDMDMDNSEDSLNKLQLLVGKINDNDSESLKVNKIFVRARSKSIKNIDTLKLKYTNSPRTKQIKRVSLYDLNAKKIMRHKKRKGTEIKFNRKKVVIDKVIIKDTIKNKNKNKKKATKEEMKQHLIDKRNEINEIKRLILSNDIGSNNPLLDVVKKGFVFINDKENKTIIEKKINKNFEGKKLMKIDENESESNKALIIKEKIRNLFENKNVFDLCNRDNYHLFKNKKNIFKNLNDCLNEYRFYNKAEDNSIEKERYYKKKIMPGLFDNKVNKIFKNKIENNKTIKIFPSLGTITPVRKKYSITSGTYCKKYSKLNNILFGNAIKKNKNKLVLSHKKENNYFVDSILINNNDEQNTRLFNNIMERQENSIYKFYKNTIKEKKTPLIMYKLNHFKNINLTEGNNTNNIKSNNNHIRFLINASSEANKNKKINHPEYNNNSIFMKNSKEKMLSLRINKNFNNNTIRVINNDRINSKNNRRIIRIKGQKNNEFNISKSLNKNDDKNNYKDKIKIVVSKNIKKKLMQK